MIKTENKTVAVCRKKSKRFEFVDSETRLFYDSQKSFFGNVFSGITDLRRFWGLYQIS